MQNKIEGVIIILGSPNDSEGNLSQMGRGRVQLGYETYIKLRDDTYRILLTGGFGEHFNTTDKPNAYYAKKILLEKGIPEDHIVEFAESRNTVDDALQARPIVEKYGVEELIVISSDFHLGRVTFVFNAVFPDRNVQYLGAPYLETRSPEEQEKLLAHEARELGSLRERGESIVGGNIKIDSWKTKLDRSNEITR